MRKCVIFGCGFQGRTSIHKLSKFYDVICWSDNNAELWDTEIENLPVISTSKLAELCAEQDIDVFICTLSFQPLISQLRSTCDNLFICAWGFFYRVGRDCVLYPYALEKAQPYSKVKPDEKNIFFVQDTPCIRTHKIASVMAGRGYSVFLLYVFCPPEDTMYASYCGQYQKIFTVSSPDELMTFVNMSEFDIVHSSNAPDIITNVLLHTNKKIVFDVHDTVTLAGDEPITFMNLIFENLANTACKGLIYTSPGILAISKKRYNIGDKPAISLGNLPLREITLETRLSRLSERDGELHLVYAGSISRIPGNPKNTIIQWRRICAAGIHIHFYTNMNPDYCHGLVEEIPRLHYEGMVSRNALLREMTKYDAGLFILNINDENRTFLETASPNKLYEYLNAELPVICCDLDLCRDFIDRYNAGIILDFDEDIFQQIEDACKIKIGKGFLTRHHLTMEASGEKLEQFYQDVMACKER